MRARRILFNLSAISVPTVVFALAVSLLGGTTATANDLSSPTTPPPTPMETLPPTPEPTQLPPTQEPTTPSPTTPAPAPTTPSTGGGEPVDPVPNGMTITSITPTGTSLSIAFTGPSNGANLQYIRVVLNGQSQVANGTTSPIIVDGLTPDTAYTVAIRGGNPSGDGPLSNSQSTRTLATLEAPAAPLVTSSGLSATSVTIRVAAPTRDGGAPITSYQLSGGNADAQSSATVFERTYTNLQPGREYTFSATATNRIGTSKAATLTVRTSTSVPGIVRDLSATVSRGVATVRWTAPESDGGTPITGYTATISGIGSCTTTATSCTIAGLKPNVATAYSVTAANSVGTSAAATASVTFVATVPSAPVAVTVGRRETALNLFATVRVTPSRDDGGLPITGYVVNATWEEMRDKKNGTPYRPTPGRCEFGPSQIAAGTLSCEFKYVPVTAKLKRVWAVAKNDIGLSKAAEAFVAFDLPSVPQNVRVTTGDQEIKVFWDPPKPEGSNSATSYELTRYGYLFFCTAKPADGVCTIKRDDGPLINGNTYAYELRARNGAGVSEPVPVTAVPFGKPSAPWRVTATAGVGKATVRWAEARDNGRPIIQYRVRIVGQQTNACVVPGTAERVCDIASPNGRSVKFTVEAQNAAGWSPVQESDAVTPLRTPNAPTGVRVEQVDDTYAQVSWNFANAADASPATGFVAKDSLTGAECSAQAAARSCNLWMGEQRGARTITVYANSAVGRGAVSAPSASFAMVSRPNAPSAPTVTVGETFVRVSWTPAASGSAPASYVVVSDPPGKTCTVSAPATSCQINGMQPGVAHAFQVQARNIAGLSERSARSDVVTPGRPVAPSVVVAEVVGARVNVRWEFSPNWLRPSFTSMVASAEDGSARCTAPPGIDACVIEQPPVDRPFRVIVTTSNDAGTARSGPSQELIVKSPGVPTNFGLVGDATRGITLQWGAPKSAGDGSLLGYEVTQDGATGVCGPVAPMASCTIPASAIQLGRTYTFTVRAVSTVGRGRAESLQYTYGAPSPVRNVKITQSGTSLTVTWDAAESSMSPLTGYSVAVPGYPTCTTTTLRCVVPGLPIGTPLVVTVTSENRYGRTSLSYPHTLVTRADAPTEVLAIPRNQSVLVSWKPPTTAAESLVSGYEIMGLSGPFSITSMCMVQGAGASSCEIKNLENGQGYSFYVRAINPLGLGKDSTASNFAVPTDEPERITGDAAPINPSTIKARLTDSELIVTWSPTANSGGARYVRYHALVNADVPGLAYWPWAYCFSYGTSCSIPISTLQRDTYFWKERFNLRLHVSVATENSKQKSAPFVHQRWSWPRSA